MPSKRPERNASEVALMCAIAASSRHATACTRHWCHTWLSSSGGPSSRSAMLVLTTKPRAVSFTTLRPSSIMARSNEAISSPRRYAAELTSRSTRADSAGSIDTATERSSRPTSGSSHSPTILTAAAGMDGSSSRETGLTAMAFGMRIHRHPSLVTASPILGVLPATRTHLARQWAGWPNRVRRGPPYGRMANPGSGSLR